jgi:long-subunit fatty acid transport protein
MHTKHILAAAVLAATSAFAHAAQPGPYIGGAFGFTSVNVDCPAYVSCDSNDTGIKFFGGYNFTHQWGVQVDYIDFGKATWTDDFTGSRLLELAPTMLGVAGVFNFDFNKQWSGSLKLGLADVTVDGSGIYGNGSQSNTKLYGGFDVHYAINPRLQLRAGWDFTNAEYTERGGYNDEGTVHLFSVGLSYHF